MKILLFDFTEKQLLKLKKMFPSIEFLIGSIYNKRKPTKKIIHNYLIESNAVIPFTRESTVPFSLRVPTATPSPNQLQVT